VEQGKEIERFPFRKRSTGQSTPAHHPLCAAVFAVSGKQATHPGKGGT
jgi:hypothetical protein